MFVAASRIWYPVATCLSSSLTNGFFASRNCSKANMRQFHQVAAPSPRLRGEAAMTHADHGLGQQAVRVLIERGLEK